jgi:hypothetical protein
MGFAYSTATGMAQPGTAHSRLPTGTQPPFTWLTMASPTKTLEFVNCQLSRNLNSFFLPRDALKPHFPSVLCTQIPQGPNYDADQDSEGPSETAMLISKRLQEM